MLLHCIALYRVMLHHIMLYNKCSYFNPNHDLVLNRTTKFYCLSLIIVKMKPNETETTMLDVHLLADW